MRKTIGITNLTDRLSKEIKALNYGDPLIITKKGKAVAVMITPAEFLDITCRLAVKEAPAND